MNRQENPLTQDFWIRALHYNETIGREYPGSIFHNDDGRIVTATWFTGNDYRNRSKLYGAYPPQFMPRVIELFPWNPTEHVIHLFAGSVKERPGEIRFDSSDQFSPTIVGNAEHLSAELRSVGYAKTAMWDLILADPPYSPEDAKRYGVKMPNVRKVLHECARVLATGGYLGWMSTTWPMFSKKELSLVGHVTIIRSTNHRTRSWFVFRKV